MEDQLDITSILTPGVQRSYRALVWGQVTLGVSPFFYQSVPPSATCKHRTLINMVAKMATPNCKDPDFYLKIIAAVLTTKV